MSDFVCSGAVSTGILQTNGRRLLVSSRLVSLGIPGGAQVLTIQNPSGGAAPVANYRVTQENGEAVQISATKYSVLLATPGASVLIVAEGGTFECVGADRQPVTFVTKLGGALVP